MTITTFIFAILVIAAVPLNAAEPLPDFVLQNGHSDAVVAVAFSPDGRLLASASRDFTIKLWDASSKRLICTLEGHRFWVETLAFSPDGQTIASGGMSDGIKLWDVSSRKLLHTFPPRAGGVDHIAFSPDGKVVASGCSRGAIELWDTTSKELIRTLHGPEEILGAAVAFSPDGAILASMSWSGTIEFWDRFSGTCLRALEAGGSDPPAIAFSPDGRTLASMDSSTIVLWDVSSGRRIRRFERLAQPLAPRALKFSPDGESLVSAGDDHAFRIWDPSRGSLVKTIERHSGLVWDVAFSPDGRTLASASDDKSIMLWAFPSGQLIGTLKGRALPVNAVAFSSDGKILASAGDDRTINLWDISSGQILRNLKGHTYAVTALAYSPTGDTLASGAGLERGPRLWDASSGEQLWGFARELGFVKSVAYSPDGRSIASACGNGTIDLWDISSKRLSRQLDAVSSEVTSVSFSPDGATLASGSQDGTLKLWNAESGKLLRTLTASLESPGIGAVAFSPDGGILAVGTRDSVVLWQTSTGKPLQSLPIPDDFVEALSFYNSGRSLAAGTLAGTITFWALPSGSILHSFRAHSSSVNALAFSPNERTLITGSTDGSLRCWGLPMGDLRATMYGLSNGDFLTYTPTGYFTASEDALHLAAWRFGDSLYTFDQYADVLNRPDCVVDALRGDKTPLPTFNLMGDRPPELVWLNPIHSTATPTYEMQLEYRGRAPLADIAIVHNGEPVDYKTDIHGNAICIPIALENYDNVFRIRAWDTHLLKSPWLSAGFAYLKGAKGPSGTPSRVNTEASTLAMYGRKYAIVIGISDYQHLDSIPRTPDELTDLKYADDDARDFIAFLRDSSRSGGGWDIREFLNSHATEANIDDTLTDIFTRASAHDLIFVFFSGHGRAHPLQQSSVYLLTYEFDPEVQRSGYSYDVLIQLIAQTKSEHVIAFIDACRSGNIGFGGKGSGDSRLKLNVLGARIQQIPPNRVIFTSASGGQNSYERPELRHGIFTYFLLKGLRGDAPDLQNRDFIDLGELYDYVRDHASEFALRVVKKHQLPDLLERNGHPDESFPVGLRRNP